MNEQNRERKPSYLKAVVGDKTDKQAELLSFEKGLSSSDAGVDNPILNSGECECENKRRDFEYLLI